MPLVVECASVVPGCGFTARAETAEEVMQKVAEHARTVHHLDPVPPELAARIKNNIHEEDRP